TEYKMKHIWLDTPFMICDAAQNLNLHARFQASPPYKSYAEAMEDRGKTGFSGYGAERALSHNGGDRMELPQILEVRFLGKGICANKHVNLNLNLNLVDLSWTHGRDHHARSAHAPHAGKFSDNKHVNLIMEEMNLNLNLAIGISLGHMGEIINLKQDENVIVNQNGVSVGGDHNGLEEEYFGDKGNANGDNHEKGNDSEMKDEEAGANDHKKMIYWMLSKMTTTISKFRKIWAMMMVKTLLPTKLDESDEDIDLKCLSPFRGLRDLAKSTFLYDNSLEYDLDFVALLETNRKDFSNERLSMIFGRENSQS
ncbi:hypothetical protein ACJX0J_042184, partial [Zea mays]